MVLRVLRWVGCLVGLGLACRPFRAVWLVGFGDCGIFGLVYCMFCGAINSVGMLCLFYHWNWWVCALDRGVVCG